MTAFTNSPLLPFPVSMWVRCDPHLTINVTSMWPAKVYSAYLTFKTVRCQNCQSMTSSLEEGFFLTVQVDFLPRLKGIEERIVAARLAAKEEEQFKGRAKIDARAFTSKTVQYSNSSHQIFKFTDPKISTDRHQFERHSAFSCTFLNYRVELLILYNQMDSPRCTVDTQRKRCDVTSELLFAYLRLFWSLFLVFWPCFLSFIEAIFQIPHLGFPVQCTVAETIFEAFVITTHTFATIPTTTRWNRSWGRLFPSLAVCYIHI